MKLSVQRYGDRYSYRRFTADMSVTDAASPIQWRAAGTSYTVVATNSGPSQRQCDVDSAGSCQYDFLFVRSALGMELCDTTPSQRRQCGLYHRRHGWVESHVLDGSESEHRSCESNHHHRNGQCEFVGDRSEFRDKQPQSRPSVGATAQGQMTVTDSASPYPVQAGSDITSRRRRQIWAVVRQQIQL